MDVWTVSDCAWNDYINYVVLVLQTAHFLLPTSPTSWGLLGRPHFMYTYLYKCSFTEGGRFVILTIQNWGKRRLLNVKKSKNLFAKVDI